MMNIFRLFNKNDKFLESDITATKIRELPFEKFEALCNEILEAEKWELVGEPQRGINGYSVVLERGETQAILHVLKYEKIPLLLKPLRIMYDTSMRDYPHHIFFVIAQNRFASECFEDRCSSLILRKEVILMDAEHLSMVLRKKRK